MSNYNTNLPKLRITRHPIDPQTGRPARIPSSSPAPARPMRVVRLRVSPDDYNQPGAEVLHRSSASAQPPVVKTSSLPQRQLATSVEDTDPFVEPKKAPVVRPFWRAQGVPTTIDRLKVEFATDPVLGPVYGPHVAWMEEEKCRRLSQPKPSPPMPIPTCRQPPPPPRQRSPTPRRRCPVPDLTDTPSNTYEASSASSMASEFVHSVRDITHTLSEPVYESTGYLTTTQSVELRTSEFDTFDNFTSVGHGWSPTTSSTVSSRSASHHSSSHRSVSSQATRSSTSDPASDSQEEDGYESDDTEFLWLKAALKLLKGLSREDPDRRLVLAAIKRRCRKSPEALEVKCTDLASQSQTEDKSESDDSVEIEDNSAWERQYDYYKQEMPAQPSQVESRPVSRCSSFSGAPDAECTDLASEYQSEVDNQSEDDDANDADETDDKSTWQSEYEAYRRDREASRREVEDNSDDNDDTISRASTCHLCGDLTCQDPHCMRRQGRLPSPKLEITPERQAEIDNDPMFEAFEREASARYLADQAERARTAAPLPPPRLRQPEARIPTIPDNHDSEEDTTGSITARLNSITGSFRMALDAIRARIVSAFRFGRS
ncbi:hypothetical protein W97_03403 [Coniosporium apollinis CBS 100218]|uniref:Uncharacterized protein n=1 Tax=Coniosporium apollinis (strain CBS 100218) TaxID=1168221 RepID=R7YQQ2_CONA1|nr:uncharacterized protein W97_03403 [Coniosporium apollinis CBS 100218]EON64173.1 hypothetical protein W97_03403 [Coniosporium apollinis CBS 100218]